MNIKLWHIVVFVLALVAFALARAPASVVVPQRPEAFTYVRATGTVWDATLEQVRIGNYAVDTLTWRISALDLVRGKLIVPLRLSGEIEGDVTLLANWEGDRRIVVRRARLQGLPLGAVVLGGETQIEGLDIFFENGVCATAAGQMRSDVIARAGQALRFVGPDLAGVAVCEGEDAVIQLNGQSADSGRVSATMRLRGNGGGDWRVSIEGASDEAVTALGAAGFERDDALGALVKREDLKWLPF